MAVYDFSCQECKENFRVSCPIDERGNVRCPKCGSAQLQRIFRPVGVVGGAGSAAGTGQAPPLPSRGFG